MYAVQCTPYTVRVYKCKYMYVYMYVNIRACICVAPVSVSVYLCVCMYVCYFPNVSHRTIIARRTEIVTYACDFTTIAVVSEKSSTILYATISLATYVELREIFEGESFQR